MDGSSLHLLPFTIINRLLDFKWRVHLKVVVSQAIFGSHFKIPCESVKDVCISRAEPT